MKNIAQLETDLARVKTLAENKLRGTLAAASDDNRLVTPTEKAAIEALISEGNEIKKQLDRQRGDANMAIAIDQLTSGMATRSSSPGRRGSGNSLSQQILNSEMGQWLLANKGRFPTGQWTSPSSELPPGVIVATTLTEGAGTGGAALVHPDVQPGVVDLRTRPITIAALCIPAVTTSNVVQYTKETAFTNAAAPVLEGGLKPESTLVYASATSPVQKIAHWIPVSEELLEDEPAAEAMINGKMRTGVLLTEDDELLNGNGTAPHLLGFLNLPGLAPAVARGTDSNADAIFKQMTAIATSTFMTPSAVVMHPLNWQSIQLTKLTTGEYASGGSPLAAPAAPSVWGLPVVVSSLIPPNVALVGCFATAAYVFRRGGLRVEASNSHASFFINNLVAIRAEERIALTVTREAAFGLVSGLS